MVRMIVLRCLIQLVSLFQNINDKIISNYTLAAKVVCDACMTLD